MNLSSKLIRLRQQHALSQEDLAQRLHVARQTISKWETGQVVPELASLIDLCDLYGLSLDRLVRDDDCAPAIAHEGQAPQQMVEFLLRAKRATYAAHAPEIPSQRPGCHEYLFEEGAWRYLDSYYGAAAFAGLETVWHHNQPVWCMNYTGRVIAEPFSGDFLKEALLLGTSDAPYRGPHLFRHGDWTYTCRSGGDVAWFSGSENIYYQNDLVYELTFHGTALR